MKGSNNSKRRRLTTLTPPNAFVRKIIASGEQFADMFSRQIYWHRFIGGHAVQVPNPDYQESRGPCSGNQEFLMKWKGGGITRVKEV